MRRKNQWFGEALRAEVQRLRALNLTAQQISQIMGIAESTARNTLSELGLPARIAKPKSERQIQNLIKLVEADPQPVVAHANNTIERGTDETPANYANRVLKYAGKLPVVGMIYAERIRLANLELKARGYPQIADRREWVL